MKYNSYLKQSCSYHTLASASAPMLRAPCASRASAHAQTDAPVVMTSSMRRRRIPTTESTTSTVPARLLRLSSRPSSRWSFAGVRTSASASGKPTSQESSLATSSIWSKPRFLKAAQVAALKQSSSGSGLFSTSTGYHAGQLNHRDAAPPTFPAKCILTNYI